MNNFLTAVSSNSRTLGFQPNNDGAEPSTATKLCSRCKERPQLSYHCYCSVCHLLCVKESHARTGYKSWLRAGVNSKGRYDPEYYQRRYREVHNKIIAYKLEHGCKDCGYKEHHAGLEFDHLPEFEKLHSPTGLAGRGWKSVLKEIAKCDVVCGNCHNIRTWNRNHGDL